MRIPFRGEEVRCATIALGAMLIGLLIGAYFIPVERLPKPLYLFQRSEYHYISPLLSCGDPAQATPKDVAELEDKVKKYIDAQKSAGRASDISVYFRDLKNESSFSVGSRDTFSPGSLLKVPLMMSVLSEAETHPDILQKPVVHTSDPNALNQSISPEKLIDGKKYRLEELMVNMITESDNSSANEVYRTLGADKVNKTYEDLGLKSPVLSQDYSISVHDYARFFQYLYNSTYLPYHSSERALQILAESSFKDGIVAGVPSTVVVAHKFGERELGDVDQLHDCGIVYEEHEPYILCIMTRGTDLTQLSAILKGVSSIVYTTIHTP